MIGNRHAAVLVAVMALVTFGLRFLPFAVFRRKMPAVILYLGRVLPPAMIGMLIVYCLKDTSLTVSPFGLPELIATLAVVLLQAWKHNSMISILSGTVIYMFLIKL